MALALVDVVKRLRELVAALDRRAPRAERAGEAAIARDAATLRQSAVNRLAEIADESPSPSDDRQAGPSDR
jgi:phosphoserine phosphatase